MAKILLVEDNAAVTHELVEWLSAQQHVVESVENGLDAELRLRHYQYDVVILDWDLPGKSGIDVCRDYRIRGGKIPILMLTGKTASVDKTTGLDTGADDYITKPFDFSELAARIRAVLRRPSNCVGESLRVGNITLDPVTRRVEVDNHAVELFPKEFAILEFLMRHPKQVFSADALLNRVWSSESDASVDTIYTYVGTLRKKLSMGSRSSMIRTIHGVGYILQPDTESAR